MTTIKTVKVQIQELLRRIQVVEEEKYYLTLKAHDVQILKNKIVELKYKIQNERNE
ncbi:681_t:CDS:1, partial [Racocetra fulgida]